MFHRIAPVGNPISWRHSSPPPTLVAREERCLLLNSGTAALAAALEIASEYANLPKPEVIMPGYACPDIISAAVFAGLTPVLVDITPQHPYMSLQEISAVINHNTVAILALNFLGIPERIENIRQLIGEKKIVLIEDSAQWFPDTNPVSSSFSTDMVVLSFGKGKPVSLPGGGALLIRNSELNNHIKTYSSEKLSFFDRLKLRAIPPLYNCLISPLLYWLLESMPGSKLGETHYDVLDDISTMNSIQGKHLAENIRRYQQRDQTTQLAIKEVLDTFPEKVYDLPSHCNSYNGQRLLRYPVLLPTAASRETVLAELINAGAGASPFYPSVLPSITGVAEHVVCHSALPHATDFAARLITLPTHTNVTNRHIFALKSALKDSQGQPA